MDIKEYSNSTNEQFKTNLEEYRSRKNSQINHDKEVLKVCMKDYKPYGPQWLYPEKSIIEKKSENYEVASDLSNY